MDTSLLDFFRCPEEFADVRTAGGLSSRSGFFRFGQIVCHGQCAGEAPASQIGPELVDKSADVRSSHGEVFLPFELSQVVASLRSEQYAREFRLQRDVRLTAGLTKQMYYWVRPLLPVPLRKHLQRIYLNGWEKIAFPEWPVDFTVDSLVRSVLALLMKSQHVEQIPFIWFWPAHAPSCVIMTHDVEAAAGRAFCSQLMDLDDRFSVESSFQIVPEGRYETRNGFLDAFHRRGFEVNVHDLNHDGHLFRENEEFRRRAAEINRYAKLFGAEGFRSGAMYRNQDWYDLLDFSYDMSVPNVAHLEPQRGGCCTVMPYFIGRLVELPLTTIQDYSLFHILGDYSINLWKQQIESIIRRNGLISFITHPDYLIEERARAVYVELLSHLATLRDQRKLWFALPREVSQWWRDRHQMRLVPDGSRWKIEGPRSDRATVAYATLAGEQVVYSMNPKEVAVQN